MKETGSYQGYKLRQYWVINLSVSPLHNQLQHSMLVAEFVISWNITTVRCIVRTDGNAISFVVPVNRDVTKREHPEPLRPFLPEVAAFARHNHFDVLHPLLR